MAIQILNARFTVRNDSAEKWESSNPILLKGEIGLENDTNQFKFGDGATPWNELKHVTLPLNPETPVVESLKINGELLEKNLVTFMMKLMRKQRKTSLHNLQMDS